MREAAVVWDASMIQISSYLLVDSSENFGLSVDEDAEFLKLCDAMLLLLLLRRLNQIIFCEE